MFDDEGMTQRLNKISECFFFINNDKKKKKIKFLKADMATTNIYASKNLYNYIIFHTV